MIPDLILLFNHTLTSEQEEDARKSLGVDGFIAMPEDVRKIWGQVPADLTEISDYLRPVKQWLADAAKAGDYVLIQGDFGGTYLLVNYAKELQLKSVYATTTREAGELQLPNGNVKVEHVFRHRVFREYGK